MSNRDSILLENVVLQESPSSLGGSPSLASSRMSVSIPIHELLGVSSSSKKKERRKDGKKRRKKTKPGTLRYYQKYIRKFLRRKEWIIFMLIITVYVLFVDDIVAMAKAYENNGLGLGIGISKMVVLGLFVAEFALQLFADRRAYHPLTLFFWLDLLAIGSMIPDILLLAYNNSAPSTVSMLAIARAGRAARASGRVARILRVSQFYSCCGYGMKEDEKNSDASSTVGLEPSKMGNRLINRTTNAVVVIVLVLMFVSAILQTDLDATPFVRAGMGELAVLRDSGDATGYAQATARYISAQSKLIYLQVRGDILYRDQSAMDGIFDTSLLKYKSDSDDTGTSGVRSEAWFDNRDMMATEAGYNLGILILVMILLTVGNLFIIRDATRMVIGPMERVMAVIKQLTPDSQPPPGRRRDSMRGRDRRSRDFSESQTEDLTTSSGVDDDDTDEADAIFGMLNDLDGNLQAARERAEFESGENTRLRHRVMDLIAEKKLLEVQVTGIKRRARTRKPPATSDAGADADDDGLVDIVDSAMQAFRAMSRTSQPVAKVNFGLAIGGRKFVSYHETDGPDIRFTSHAASTSSNSLPIPPAPPSPPSPPTPPPPASSSSSPVLSPASDGEGSSLTQHAPARLELPQVQAATIDRLIERLTYEEYTDPKFINTFLLTYRTLLSPIELMERMFVRYCSVTPSLALPKETSLEVVDEWRKSKQEPVRVGVYNAMKFWIGRYFWDFHNNEELVEMLHDFMFNLLPSTSMDRHATNIEILYKKKVDEKDDEPEIPYTPPPVLSEEELTTLQIGPAEFTRYEVSDLAIQLTIVEHDLFRAIRPNELLNQAWTKKNKEKDSPNILRLIDHFNNISAWIKTQVVKVSKAKERAHVIKKAVQLGEELLKLNNFNGAMEVLAALSNASVSRLKRTWELLPAATDESFRDLGAVMSSQGSFKLYRERLRACTPPCIPYIGVYLSDLVFIDEGNPDRVSDDPRLVNFDKHRQVAAVIAEIQRYQQGSYEESERGHVQRDEEIIEFLNQAKGIDDDAAYKASLLAEPRARSGSMQVERPLTPTSSFLQRLRNSSNPQNPNGTL